MASADRLLRAPHSETATAAELHSACRELLPRYAHALNAAYKRHLAARGNAQRVALQAADTCLHERLARQARSWGVELSV